jgi:MFS family permease
VPDSPPDAAPPARFGDVFAVAEFRALWLAQLLSVTGDQLARVALTVLVYDRTRSAMLAAVTFAASIVPAFIGGLALGGLADRLPRRAVMITADLGRLLLVCIMALPGTPLAALIALLFMVTMAGAPFTAARAAIYPDLLTGDRYVLGTAVTQTTTQFAQLAGFSSGGVLVGFLGVRACLLADAATFAASALIIRVWLRPRPAARSAPAAGRLRGSRPDRAAGPVGALRLVFGRPALRTPMLFAWLAAFYNVPEGVAAPLAKEMGGRAATIGFILAAQTLGAAVGAIGFSRLVGPARRVSWTGPLAVAASGVLLLFAAGPDLPAMLFILAGSGMFSCYQLAANASFVRAAPASHRSQAFGLAQGGLTLGQGTAMILAGGAADRIAPATVIVAAAGLGALCAVVLAIGEPARSARPRPGKVIPEQGELHREGCSKPPSAVASRARIS